MNEILQRIEGLREQHSLSVYKLSKELHITQSTYSTWVKKDRTPKADVLQQIADYFGVTVDYLLNGEQKTEWKPTLSDKEISDIGTEVQNTLNALDSETGLMFDGEILDEENHQGVAVVNYTAREVPYTRIIEHKHFEFGTQPKTVLTREYPADWKPGDEPYYPVNDARNEALYAEYEKLAAEEGDVVFAGRLGGYKYYDMDKAVAAAFDLVKKELGVEIAK